MHPPSFLLSFICGVFSANGLLGLRFHFRFEPNASQRPLDIARRHPDAAQALCLPNQIDLVHHGSSSGQSKRGFAIRTQKGAIRATQWFDGLSVREGESGLKFQRLTRSIHMLYVVKSGEEIVDSQARGGFQSAHHGTEKNSSYSGVPVRIHCS
jgi:hypothetical protein